MEPETIADTAATFASQGNVGVAYTYNEPLVGYEFVRDCSQAVHERGLVSVLVSNGQVNDAPLSELLPLIDAANIDLKASPRKSIANWAAILLPLCTRSRPSRVAPPRTLR